MTQVLQDKDTELERLQMNESRLALEERDKFEVEHEMIRAQLSDLHEKV